MHWVETFPQGIIQNSHVMRTSLASRSIFTRSFAFMIHIKMTSIAINQKLRIIPQRQYLFKHVSNKYPIVIIRIRSTCKSCGEQIWYKTSLCGPDWSVACGREVIRDVECCLCEIESGWHGFIQHACVWARYTWLIQDIGVTSSRFAEENSGDTKYLHRYKPSCKSRKSSEKQEKVGLYEDVEEYLIVNLNAILEVVRRIQNEEIFCENYFLLNSFYPGWIFQSRNPSLLVS